MANLEYEINGQRRLLKLTADNVLMAEGGNTLENEMREVRNTTLKVIVSESKPNENNVLWINPNEIESGGSVDSTILNRIAELEKKVAELSERPVLPEKPIVVELVHDTSVTPPVYATNPANHYVRVANIRQGIEPNTQYQVVSNQPDNNVSSNYITNDTSNLLMTKLTPGQPSLITSSSNGYLYLVSRPARDHEGTTYQYNLNQIVDGSYKVTISKVVG